MQRDPRNAPAYLGLASLLAGEGQLQEAHTPLQKGLVPVPGDLGLNLMRASLLEQQGKVDDAVALYEKLLKQRPNAEVVINNLASLLSDARSDEASYKRAYDLAQGLRGSAMPQFLDTVGWAAYRMKRYAEAAGPLRDAAKAMPDSPTLNYHLGMNLLAQGNKEGARKALQQALDLAAKGAPFAAADEAKKALAGI